MESFQIKRTTTDDPAFVHLTALLDHELWVELNEDQATYDQYNKVPALQTAVVVYAGKEPVACGCFKHFDKETIEVKRMFVKKDFRGKGLSKQVLAELESWAMSEGYQYAVLETSIHFATALHLYKGAAYGVIPNYPPYVGLPESICLRKNL